MAINIKGTTLKNGSKGSDVKELQKKLQAAGYNVGGTGADGIYGKNTAAAVKQYQKDNGLAVDGIAGKNTLTSLFTVAEPVTIGTISKNAANSAAGNNAKTVADESANEVKVTEDNSDADIAPNESAIAKKPFEYEEFTYHNYTESDVVNQANTLLQQHQSSKPGAYQSQWQDEIDDYLNRIENRDPFSYDFNSDALYQQYKDNYIQQGQMAMMDTMGQAAAMTGGYGNSYAQSVGQQAYNQQLNQLNNVLPELYQMAYNRYSDEGQRLMDMYNMYLGQESLDYSRYQTDLSNWYTDLEYLTNRYENERELDYNNYQAGRTEAHNDYLANKEIAYKDYTTEQDRAWDEYLKTEANKQTAAELMASTGNYDRLQEIYGLSDEEVAQIKKANTKSSGGGGSSKKTQTYKTLTHDDLATIQKNVDKTETVGALANLAGVYESMGYDPAVINSLTSEKYNSLTGGSTVNTTVTTTTPIEDWEKNHYYGGNKNTTNLLK